MKIAYICTDPGVPVFGNKGSSLHVQEMIHAFGQNGCEVHLFARRLGGRPPENLKNIRVSSLPALPGKGSSDRERHAMESNVQIARKISASAPFDIAYERYSLWSHEALTTAGRLGAAKVLEVNAPLVEEQSKFRVLHDRRSALEMSCKVFGAADSIVAVSREVADYLAQYTETEGKVVVVPNGVNLSRFDSVVADRFRKSTPFTVGFIGTLKPWHGLDNLLAAFMMFLPECPEARLLIVGDGPEAEKLKFRVFNDGITDSVHFTGAVAPTNIPRYLAQMDVGVAPYPETDSFYFSPMKIFEYMASGLPVVASRIGQIPEVVEHGKTGLLCEPGDVEALAEALKYVNRHVNESAGMGHLGQKKVAENHSWKSIARQILDLAGTRRNPNGDSVTQEFARHPADDKD